MNKKEIIEEKCKIGKAIIEALNKELGTTIEVTNDNCKKALDVVDGIVGDESDYFMEGGDYGYCPDCDQRRGEPQHNEGYM